MSIQVGDIGTRIILKLIDEDKIPVNISAATVRKIFLKPPTGTTLEKSAIFLTTGTDGKIYYDTIANDLSTSGNWKVQGYVETPAGKWHSAVASLKVEANL